MIMHICLAALILAFLGDVGFTYFFRLKKSNIPVEVYIKSKAFIIPLMLWAGTFILFTTSVMISR